jgi:hypothetical protein
MNSSLEIDKLAPALVALQADLKPVEKSATNPFFKSKYADLPAVMESIQPLLTKHKLAVSQFVSHLNGASALRTLLIHESGQLLEDTQPLLLPQAHEEEKWDKDAKQLVTKFVVPTSQDQGSAITYARRYGLMSVLGIVADEDDDGNKASSHSSSKSYAASADRPATESQLNLIRDLAKKIGTPQESIDARIKQIKTSAEASEAIQKLKG